MSPKGQTSFRIPLYDLSGGIVGNISEADVRRGRPRWLKRSDNMLSEPPRALTLRSGSRALSTALMTSVGHSIGKIRTSAGVQKLFVGRGTGIVLATTTAYTAQTLPASLGGSELRFEQLNDVLWVAEHGGTNKPFGFIDGLGWVAIESPVVTPAPDVAVGAAGNVNAGVHFYRVRNRFVNGASLAIALSPSSVNPGVASTINIGAVTPLPTAGPGGRTDWLGWTIERTKANDPKGASGVWYQVAFGTTATYADNTADSLLWDAVTEGWYTGPQVFNGIVPHRQRMFGWKGHLLYPSWEIAANASLGIFNFDPLNALRVGSDDGDSIVAATPRAGQLVLAKSRSVHVLDGSDLFTFEVVDVPETGGAAGPRCLCTVGGDKVFIYNDDGLFIMRRNALEPFGWEQIGHYLADIIDVRRSKVVLRAIGTRYLFMGYSSGLSSFNNEALLYDFRTRTWAHFNKFNADDLFYQEDADFVNARAIVADGEDQGGGLFGCWIELDGVKRKRAQNGTGGSDIPAYFETPLLDGGLPEAWKDVRRIVLSAIGESQSVTVTITGESGESQSVTILLSLFGSGWGDDDGVIDAEDLVWDDRDWAGDEEQDSVPVPIDKGLVAKRFKVSLTLNASRAFRFNGLTIEGNILPARSMRQ
jgi:hypothetical protein